MQSVIYLARSGGGGGDEGGGGSQRPATQFFNQYPIDAALCGNAYSHSRRRARKKLIAYFFILHLRLQRAFFLLGVAEVQSFKNSNGLDCFDFLRMLSV